MELESHYIVKLRPQEASGEAVKPLFAASVDSRGKEPGL